MRDFSTLGDKLGPKLVKLISDAIIATKRGLIPHEHAVRVSATQAVIDHAGHEIADLYRPIIDKMLALDDGSLDPDVRHFLEQAKSGEHQLKAAAGLLLGPVSGAISTFLNNELAPFVYGVVGVNPRLRLDPQTSANAAAEQIVPYGDAERSAMDQGYDAGPFAAMYTLAQQYPPIADGLDMLRRGHISPAQFTLILQRSASPSQFYDAWRSMREVPLPPDLAALAVLRGAMTQQQGEKTAALSGVSAADFQIMIDDTGEPPGPEQLDEAFRRRIIDKARLERGIRQSRIRNEWIDVIEALRFVPMSVADAVNATVQNHLTAQQASVIAEENGLTPGAVDTLIQSAGEPLSRTEMEQLYNRGRVTKAEVEQALRESRLKNKYIGAAFDLHVRLLEPRMLSSAVEFGVISHADAVKRAMEYGFSAADAAILVNEGSARKLRTYRERVVSAAEGLYEVNALPDARFLSIAKAMGFDQAEADFILQSAEFRRQQKILTSVMAAIRSKYIAHHITEGQASGLLDTAGIPAAQRDAALKLWKIEAAANVRKLTPAQVVKALKLKHITAADAAERLIADGYTPEDVMLILEGV